MKTSRPRAPCSTCLGETEHNVLHSVDRSNERMDWRFTLLECAGCGHIVLREVVDFGSPEDTVIRYNPSPTSRKVPHWVYDMSVGLRVGEELPR
jgi:hypothetical protein